MRADVWRRLRPRLAAALAGRTLRLRWAVVPEPTRTLEALAALYSGRPVPAGSAPTAPAELGVPVAVFGPAPGPAGATAPPPVSRPGSS